MSPITYRVLANVCWLLQVDFVEQRILRWMSSVVPYRNTGTKYRCFGKPCEQRSTLRYLSIAAWYWRIISMGIVGGSESAWRCHPCSISFSRLFKCLVTPGLDHVRESLRRIGRTNYTKPRFLCRSCWQPTFPLLTLFKVLKYRFESRTMFRLRCKN